MLKPFQSGENIVALARRYLPFAREVTAVHEGTRHLAYEIDGRLILKIRRPGTIDAELRCEALVLTHLRGSGLPVPDVIGFEDGPGDTGHLCLPKMRGIPLLDLPWSWPSRVLGEIGEALAVLHSCPIGDLIAVDEVERLDVEASWEMGLRFLEARQLVSDQEGRELQALFLGLRPQASPDQVLLWGDFWPHHCFVDPASGALTGLIDFADATIGPRAVEFAWRWANQLELAEDEIVSAYCRALSLDESKIRREVEFYRLFKAVRVPAWAESRGIDSIGTRSSLREIRRQLSSNEVGGLLP